MPDTACWDKVEDAIKAVLDDETGSGGDLEGWTVLASQSADVAIDHEVDSIVIWTVAVSIDQADELNQSMHSQTIEIEFVKGRAPAGTLNRENKLGMAYVHALIAADRSIGGRLHDIQEVDIAPARIEGKDVNGASLQYLAQFFTARDNWLTIIGQGGVEF